MISEEGNFRPNQTLWGIFRANGLFKDTFNLSGKGYIHLNVFFISITFISIPKLRFPKTKHILNIFLRLIFVY